MNFEAFLKTPIAKMSHVVRYSGLPIVHRETLAEHTFWVTYVAWFLGLDWQQSYKGDTTDVRYNIDWYRLFTGCLSHDNEEVVTGDFPRPFKYASPELREAIDKEAHVSFEMLASDFGKALGISANGNVDISRVFTMMLSFAWDHAKEVSRIEGVITSLADNFSILFYAYQEQQLGNRSIASELNALEESLDRLEDSVEDQIILPWLNKHTLSLRFILKIIREGRTL